MLLQREEKYFSTYKELAKLHELLDYNEESIKFYKPMIEIECNSTSWEILHKAKCHYGITSRP